MRAKFTYESIGDVLRPKTQDQIVNDLSKLPQQELNSKLIEASYNGYVDIVVRLLLGAGANVDAKNNWNETALIYASRNDFSEAARLLLEAGANIDAKDYNGWTALIWASRYGHVEVVRLLKKYGAKYFYQ